MNAALFNFLVFIWILIAVIVFIALLFVTAPYGRHTRSKWGITISDRAGWFIMEVPALIIFTLLVASGKADKNLCLYIIAGCYILHYANRSLIYPLRIKKGEKKMPLTIALMAFTFNTVNASFLGYHAGTLQTTCTTEWLRDPRFICGLLLFIAGLTINIRYDDKLLHLRKEKNNGYRIPFGGLFEQVSCPNYLGEIIEWAGYALLCWSLPALSFFCWTFCNLVPRALSNHKWYKSRFPDYPSGRKAVIPYIL